MSTLAPSPAPARNVDDASLVYHINLLQPHSNSNSSHSPYNNYHDEKRPRPPIVLNFPPHIASCIKPLRPLLTPLRARLAPGFTVGQVLILIVYFYTIVYAGFYRSNVFTDSARTGWIAIAQLPFVFAFAQKNNILGGLLGYGYERLNFLHRFAGRLVVLAANIHSLHYCYSWSLAGTFTKSIQRPSSMWGMVALVCVDVIFLFSTQAVRNKAYNLFLSSHIVAFILVLPAVYLHKPTMLPYVYACLVIYIADIFFRCIKSRITTAYIRPIPELDLTRVEIPSVNAGWRAGQHVRLRVCSMRMGWIGWTEVHPFTIASVAKSEEGMVLMCKKAGDWTNKLYEVAKRGAYTEGGVGSEVSVVLDGPYGGPGHTIYASFSAAVLIVGGSGITYALSVIQDLVQKDLVGESRVKIIELVWIVTDPACLSPLLPIFKQIIAMSVHTPVRISVFYSRAPTGKQPAFFSSVEAGPFTSPDLGSRNEKDQQQGVQRRPSAPQRNMSTRTKVRTILQAEGHQFTIPPVPGIVSPISPTGGEADYLPRPRPPPSRRPSSPYKSPRTAPQPPKPALLQTQLQGREQESGESGADLQRQESSASTSSNTHESNSPTSRYAPAYAPSQSPHFPPGLTLAPGKPKLVKFLEHALQRAVTLSHAHGRRERAKSEGRPSGMVVGVCGPVGLADDVAGAVGALDPVRRDQVGGVEMCEEVFGW